MSEALKPITQVIGGVGSVLGLGSTATPTIKQASSVNTEDAINQADDLLRRRSRQGVNANILSGGSSNTISASSTGQKTLLGG
ncbi:hypothetical protein [Phytobacter sp. AG2a]